jgi:flagellar hook-associated protein 2
VSDISIPGVTASKYKTDELIQGLMKAERVPRDRADAELKTYKKQQSAWRDLNQQSTKLRDSAKSMYSYDNPFMEKTSTSTNERAVTATAAREAQDQSFKIAVSQVAAADSFLSSEIASDGKVPKGAYEFSVGDSKISFAWKGGSYREFVDALNRRGNGVIRASLVKVTDKTQSLMIESLKTGSKQRLSFGGDALPFALDAGLIKKNDASVITPSQTALDAPPASAATINFSSTAKASDGLVLEYAVSWTTASAEEKNAAAAAPTGPDTGKPGGITYGGITIENAAPETALTETPVAAPKEPVIDSSVFSLKTTKGVAVPLPPIPDNGTKTTVTVPLNEYGDVTAILANNKNTGKSVRIEDIRIYDPKAAGEYRPVNPVSVAQDAIMKYEGITITRPTNEIDDLVPGVTINLHEPTEKTETISIKPDTEPAKQAIISLVANYNRVMAEINILTQDKPEIISEIEYFTEDEKKAETEKLGMMMGDTTLSSIKNSLQRTASNSYKPGTGNTLSMLAQIGISTKSTAGAGIDSSRMRGYLEIDEKKLDDALKNRTKEVKALFGYDSDGDLIVDSGVGQAMDAALSPYVQTGGIFGLKTSGLATRISASEKKIAQLDEQLKKKEADLKNKYGQMEGTLNSLQSQSNSISNFSKQNGN